MHLMESQILYTSQCCCEVMGNNMYTHIDCSEERSNLFHIQPSESQIFIGGNFFVVLMAICVLSAAIVQYTIYLWSLQRDH